MPNLIRPQTTIQRVLPTFPILWSYHVKETIAALQKAAVPYLPVSIPYAMLDPHEAQAKRNHGQTLARLADRGGLGASEALAILDDRRWHSMNEVVACEELCRRIEAWIAREVVDHNG